MNRKRKRAKRRRQSIQAWTFAQAHAALPYVRSIVTSLREHRVDAQKHRRTAARLRNQLGRLNRTALIAQAEAVRSAAEAEDRFQEALDELAVLDIFCLDPIRGEALIPFVQGDELAWFIFDLFDMNPLRYWRYHREPLTQRHPVTNRERGTLADDSAARAAG